MSTFIGMFREVVFQHLSDFWFVVRVFGHPCDGGSRCAHRWDRGGQLQSIQDGGDRVAIDRQSRRDVRLWAEHAQRTEDAARQERKAAQRRHDELLVEIGSLRAALADSRRALRASTREIESTAPVAN